jgi:integrase
MHNGYHDAGKPVCHPAGRPVHPDTITARHNRLCDRAGVQRVRLHDIRHFYVTESLDAGIEPKVVADRVGRSDPARLAIYAHRSTRKDRGAAETVARALFGDGWTYANYCGLHVGTAPANRLCRDCRPD